MNFKHLESLIRIAEFGSLTRAAREMGLSQPALTRHVRTLESTLGTRLVERHERGSTITEAGQIVVDHARRMAAEREATRRALEKVGEHVASRRQ